MSRHCDKLHNINFTVNLISTEVHMLKTMNGKQEENDVNMLVCAIITLTC